MAAPIKPAEPAGPKTLQYRLRAKYWDGSAVHSVGSIVSFVEGKQPRSAVLVSAPVGTGEAEAEDEE